MAKEKFTRQEVSFLLAMAYRFGQEFTQFKFLLTTSMKTMSDAEFTKLLNEVKGKLHGHKVQKCKRCEMTTNEDFIIKRGKRYCENCVPRKLDPWRKVEAEVAIANCAFIKEEFPKAWGRVLRSIMRLARSEQESRGLYNAFLGNSIYKLKRATREEIIQSAIKNFPELMTP